ALLLIDALVRRTPLARRLTSGPWRRPIGALGWLLTFHLVVIGWVMFRADHVGDIVTVVGAIGASFVTAPSLARLWVFPALAVFLVLSRCDRKYGLLRAIDGDAGLSVVFYGALVVATVLGAPDQSAAFIYFQF